MDQAAVAAEAEAEARFDESVEPVYQQTRAALGRPPSTAGTLLLLGSLALFVILQMHSGNSVEKAALLVAVLLFHESGHWLGMRLFGYRDVKMFFIPYLGAAVSGRRAGVAAWKEAVVLLLGPLPGIVLGLVLAVVASTGAAPRLREAALMLISVNAFNLLPLGGLDGGRLFQRVLFSRHRLLELAFLVVAGVALGVLAVVLETWVLGVFAYLGVLMIPHRNRILRAAERLRRERPIAGGDVRQLADEDARAVFLAVRESFAEPVRPKVKPNVLARMMEDIVEALRPPPGALATTLLLIGWASGVIFTLVALVGLALGRVPS